MLAWFHYLFLISLLIVSAGCGGDSMEVLSEKQEKYFIRGDRYNREGNYREALSAFLKVIEKREDAAESHLEAGNLFLTHIKDPISAIYHFRKYLELRPDSQQAEFVRQLIDTAKKEFARTLAGHPFENDIDRLDLLELVNQLKLDNRRLREQLNAVGDRQTTTGESVEGEEAAGETITSPEPARDSQPATDANDVETRPAFYTIQPSDNLSRISAKVYGTPDRWMDIFQANRDKLSNPDDLRVGVELKIP